MMNDEALPDESTIPEITHLSEAVRALEDFHRAIVQLQVDCDDLMVALARREAVDVEIAAWDLACTWDATRRAYQVVHSIAPDPEQPGATRHAMRVAELGVAYVMARVITEVRHWTPRAPQLELMLHRTAHQIRLPINDGQPSATPR